MKILHVILLTLCFSIGYTQAQIYISRAAETRFYSHTPLEDIQADNKKGGVIVNMDKNEVRIIIPIIGFIFEKSLMQEHFNENYMETEKFPTASFTGAFSDKSLLNLNPSEEIKTSVKGDLTIHGVTLNCEIPCTLLMNQDQSIQVNSKFEVKLKDHDIKVPSAVGKNIAEVIQVNFSATLNNQQNIAPRSKP